MGTFTEPQLTEPYQLRVVEERAELDKRLTKLSAYLDSTACKSLSIAERNLLIDQRRVMHEYINILSERIALFERQQRAYRV